jgi:hypothetical protein
MIRTLKVLAFIAVFSQPLIGIPIGIVLGTHAAYNCKPEQAISQCITQEVELWTDRLSSLI